LSQAAFRKVAQHLKYLDVIPCSNISIWELVLYTTMSLMVVSTYGCTFYFRFPSPVFLRLTPSANRSPSLSTPVRLVKVNWWRLQDFVSWLIEVGRK